MLNRPTRVQTYMEIAHVWAKRSTCMRRNVGAVIVCRRYIVGHGYNGTPPGCDHCGGNDCPGRELCTLTTHAEKNAIDHSFSDTADVLTGSDLYTTDSPCLECARSIVRARIGRVFFAIAYRTVEGLELLRDHGVAVYHVMPAGYVLDYWTKQLVEVET